MTQWIKTSEDFFKKIYLSFYCKVCVWEGVGDRTELQYIDLLLLWPPALSLSRSHDAQPEARGPTLLAFSTASYHHLVWSPNSIGGPEGPFWWVVAFPNTSCLQLSGSQLTDFLSTPSYIIVQSPTQSSTQSLEWHVWSSSSENNCHAQLTLFRCISLWVYHRIFYFVPFFQPSPPTRFLLITAIGMYHFLPVHHFGMACLAGSKVNIQHKILLIHKYEHKIENILLFKFQLTHESYFFTLYFSWFDFSVFFFTLSSWRNGYSRRKITSWVKAVYISLHANALVKGMHPSIPPRYGQIDRKN